MGGRDREVALTRVVEPMMGVIDTMRIGCCAVQRGKVDMESGMVSSLVVKLAGMAVK
mgnify:CR=1 FL=1